MAARFDITRVKLRQYRSIAACNVEVGSLNILVGPNGSGKSNFLDSMRLTAQALNENLDNALRERGGVSEVRRRSRGHPTHFGIEFRFRLNGYSGSYAFQVGAVEGRDFRVSRETCRIESHEFGAKAWYYTVKNGEVQEQSERVMPPASNDRLYLVAAAGIDGFRPLYDGLSSINIYSINPEAMRQLQRPDPGDLLRRDGSNIASVLERLDRDRPDTKKRIEDYLGQVVAGITGVARRSYGAYEAVEFRQAVAGDAKPWTFQATSMSDGTLRALGVLAALFSGGDGVTSPVGVEEPEIALHPAAAGLLLGALRDACDQRQVFLTTHSPDLLDTPTIKPEELLAVRAEGGVTTVGRVDRAGEMALRQSLFTPGELLRVDQLSPEANPAEQAELF
jgi:predicted ATPase